MQHSGFLLDTNVVSELMRQRPDPHIKAFLQALAWQDAYVSSITVWETLNGIGRLRPGRRRETLEFRFRSLIDDVFGGRAIEWTAEDAMACAKVMEHKRRIGEPLDDHMADAMIAGTALRRGLAVVTRNEAEFRNTGVHTVNPWIGTLAIQQRLFDGRMDPSASSGCEPE